MKKIILILSILLVGCSSASNSDGKLNISTTTNIVGDLVSVIGGDRVSVTSMMASGVDPHTYKAKPSDVLAIEKADIIAFNGVTLEAKLADVLEGLGDLDKKVINIGNGIDENLILEDKDNLGVDPHIWFDVEIWKQATEYVTDKLSEYDPSNADYYASNRDDYLIELEALDSYIFRRIQEIPEDKRVLITAHDAFNYFAHRYGMEVKAIQGINTQSEAGIKDINDLADYIVSNEIKAVYPESSVPVKTVESLIASVESKGYVVKMGDELYSDSLRDDGDYIMTFKSNVDNIVEALK